MMWNKIKWKHNTTLSIFSLETWVMPVSSDSVLSVLLTDEAILKAWLSSWVVIEYHILESHFLIFQFVLKADKKKSFFLLLIKDKICIWHVIVVKVEKTLYYW